MPETTTPESTTASPEPAPDPAPAEQAAPAKARRAPRARNVQIAAGLLLSPLAFVFGLYVVLLSLPAILPKLRGATPFAATLFFGVTACWALGLAGVNPWQSAVQQTLIDELEAALGAPVQYDRVISDPAHGTMTFEGLRTKLPNNAGELKARSVTVNTGAGYIMPTASYDIIADGLDFKLDPTAAKFEEIALRVPKTVKPMNVRVSNSTLTLVTPSGATQVELRVDTFSAVMNPTTTEASAGISRIRARAFGAEHEFRTMGGVVVRLEDDGLLINPTLGFTSGDDARGTLQGEWRPGRSGGLQLVVDEADIGAIYGRHRLPGKVAGHTRTQVSMSGTLAELELSVFAEVQGVSAYHPMLMSLDESQALTIGYARIEASGTLRGGRTFTLGEATVDAHDASLATDTAVSAHGGYQLKLTRGEQHWECRLTAKVERGHIARAVSWSPVSTASLSDLEPSLLRVGRHLSNVRVRYDIEVERLDVRCFPLSGVATGRLTGVAVCERGRDVQYTVGGELAMRDGRFRFLGAQGSADVSLQFDPGRGAALANLGGEIVGSVGEVPLRIELSGLLYRPVLTFTGMTMPPDELGRLIYEGGGLTDAQRRRICLDLCGPPAAIAGNPFLARNTGKVRLQFR